MFLGWPSPTLQILNTPNTPVHLTPDQVSWMVSVLYIGSTLSPMPTGWMIDTIGRKTTLLVLSSVAISSWLFLIFVQNPMGIYIARFLGGMWGGSAYTVAPIYLCEIAQPEVRGALNSVFILMAYNGIMYEYAIGPVVSFTTLSIASAVIPILFVACILWIPESPYYYLMKQNRKSAAKSLAWLRYKSVKEVEEELTAIEKAVMVDMKNKGRLSDLISTPGNRKALLTAEMLAALQRMSGISVIMAYASTALPQTGILTSNMCAIIMCFVWIVVGVWSTILVDKLGRRPLLAISCAGCAVATAIVGAWFYLDSNTDYDARQITWFAFFGFLLYALFFPVGLGCVPSMMQGEMFPANTRGLASGVTSTLISLTSFITNKMYQSIGDAVGLYLNYWIFAVSCVFGVYFSLCQVIETRNKTLQEIQYELCERTAAKHDIVDESKSVHI